MVLLDELDVLALRTFLAAPALAAAATTAVAVGRARCCGCRRCGCRPDRCGCRRSLACRPDRCGCRSLRLPPVRCDCRRCGCRPARCGCEPLVGAARHRVLVAAVAVAAMRSRRRRSRSVVGRVVGVGTAAASQLDLPVGERLAVGSEHDLGSAIGAGDDRCRRTTGSRRSSRSRSRSPRPTLGRALAGRRGAAAGGRRRRRARSGRVEDLVDDVRLLQAGVDLDAERLGHLQKGVFVLRFEHGLFECRCGHEGSSLLVRRSGRIECSSTRGRGCVGASRVRAVGLPWQNSHTTEISGCGSVDPSDRHRTSAHRTDPRIPTDPHPPKSAAIRSRQRPDPRDFGGRTSARAGDQWWAVSGAVRCSTSACTAARSLATVWVRSGRSKRSARCAGQRRTLAGGPLDGVGELGRVRRGQRHHRMVGPIERRSASCGRGGPGGGVRVEQHARSGDGPARSRRASRRRRTRGPEVTGDELLALVGLDRRAGRWRGSG